MIITKNRILKIVFDDGTTQALVDQANDRIVELLVSLGLTFAIFGFEEKEDVQDEEPEQHHDP